MLDCAGTTTRIHKDLPIFRLDAEQREHAVLYTPGHPVATSPVRALEVERALAGDATASVEVRILARELERRGGDALRSWQQLGEKPFEPECLTLYLSNQCNLACSYCYSAPADAWRSRIRLRLHHETTTEPAFPILSAGVIAAAARLVARNCSAKRKPLTLVLHGGGEPTLHWDLLVNAWDACAATAAVENVALWSYIATHGVLSPERTRWLAQHFDLVGVSCDGPPDIQDANRPSTSGTATSAALERTARVLRDEGADYIVRCTVTPESVSRQVEIVDYLCDRLFAKKLRFEPAYNGRHTLRRSFRPDEAPAFVSQFLSACDAAKKRGCDLQLSGVRIDEIHGPFCNPSREVLQLTPNGTASACFLSVGNGETDDYVMVMGRLDPDSGAFVVDGERAAVQRRQATHVPARCRDCHNIYHCARDCPDVCFLTDPSPTGQEEGGFRCRVQKSIGRHLIFRAASHTVCFSAKRSPAGVPASSPVDKAGDCEES